MRLPVVLWSGSPPQHAITCLHVFSDGETLATGSTTGQVVFWSISARSIVPTSMTLLSAPTSVCVMAECTVDADRSFAKQFVGSAYSLLCATEDGSLFKLDGKDGRCSMASKRLFSGKVTSVLVVKAANAAIVCGYFHDIFVVNLANFAATNVTSSTVDRPDWLSCACLHRYEDQEGHAREALITLSQTGLMTTYTISASETKVDLSPIPLRAVRTSCRNALHVSICQLVHSTLLVVAADRFLLYTTCDLQLVLSVPAVSPHGWSGGAFASPGSIVLFSGDGVAYLYSFKDNGAVMKYFQAQIPQLALPARIDHTTLVPQHPSPRFNCRFVVSGPASRSSSGGAGSSPASRSSSSAGANTNDDPASDPEAPCSTESCAFVLCLSYVRGAQEPVLLRGDSGGRLASWTLPRERAAVAAAGTALQSGNGGMSSYVSLAPSRTHSLASSWLPNASIAGVAAQPTVLMHAEMAVSGGSSTSDPNTVVMGFMDGSIAIISLVELLQCMAGGPSPTSRVLKGHDGRVTCLLHPHQHTPAISAGLVMSASSDCTVRLWDQRSGRLVHTFRDHCARVTRLAPLPPKVCSRLNGGVLSVARDHSVAIMSVEPPASVYLFSGHDFPIAALRWRAAANLLMVCGPGDVVHVWDIDSCTRERVAVGLQAREIVSCCDPEVTGDERRARTVLAQCCTVHSISLGRAIAPVVVFDIPQLCLLLAPEGGRSSTLQNRVDPSVDVAVRAVLGVHISSQDTSESSLAANVGLGLSTMTGLSLGLLNAGVISLVLPGLQLTPFWTRYGEFVSTNTLTVAALSSAALRSEMAGQQPSSLAAWANLLSHFAAARSCAPHSLLRYWMHWQGDLRDVARAALTAVLTPLPNAEAALLCASCTARMPRGSLVQGDGIRHSCAILAHIFAQRKIATPDQTRVLLEALSDMALGSSPTLSRAVAMELLSGLLDQQQPPGSAVRIINIILRAAAAADSGSDLKASGCVGRALANVAAAHANLLLEALAADTTSAASPLALKAVARAVQHQPPALMEHIAKIMDFVFSCLSASPGVERVAASAHATLSSLAQCCSSVAMHSGSQRVAVGGHDGVIYIYDIKTAACVLHFRAHGKPIAATAFSSDGRNLASYSIEERQVRLWQLASGSLFGMVTHGPKNTRSQTVAALVDTSQRAALRLVWRPAGDLWLHTGNSEVRLFA